MTRHLLLALLISSPAGLHAQQPSSDAAERARISAERERAESEFNAQEKACYAKFAVNDCIEAARVQRRQLLADLRRQEVALNDVERRRRAADRVREIEARQLQQPAPRKGQETTRERLVVPSPADVPASSASPAASDPTARTRAAGPAVQAEQNARRHQQRLAEAQQHKERARKKAADDTKTHRPLPVPP